MRSLLIEEKDKTPWEIIEKYLIKIWPRVYGIIDGTINILFATVIRIMQMVFEQLGFKK